MGFDRPEYSIHIILATGLEQCEQPALESELIIVNKSDEFSACIRHRLVSRQRNVLSWLNAVADRDRMRCRELRNHGLSGPLFVVVGNDDRVGKQPVRILIGKPLQEAIQKQLPLVRTDADRKMWLLRVH